MPSTQPTISSKFPEGYGDFAIQSSDDVICYFPSQIISHVSCVFRDMFKSAGPQDQKEPTPVKVTEPIDILELFLLHNDPSFVTPALDLDTVGDLLRMADKYQVDKFITWFEQEVTFQRVIMDSPTIQMPPFISHPWLILTIAAQNNLVKVGRMAMKELVGSDYQELAGWTKLFSPCISSEIYRLRNHRLERYYPYIATLANDRGGVPSQLCDKCAEKKGQWIYGIMKAVQTKPSWKSFSSAYEDIQACGKGCGIVWSKVYSDNIPEWRASAEQQESELPAWPLSKTRLTDSISKEQPIEQ